MSHLLVVDDCLVDCRLAGGLLQGHYYVEYSSNGAEALESMEARLPLAVITDLRMPEMDGMQLVEAVRRRFPMVPVILMTAQGSEEIALQALMAGAADYIPKSKLSAELLKSVKGILAFASGGFGGKRLARCLRHEELEYELENDPLLIPPLVLQVKQAALEMGVVDDTDAVRLAKALTEALRNAIFHGNLDLSMEQTRVTVEQGSSWLSIVREQPPYCDRRVHFRATLSPREVQVVIGDDGPGFDVAHLPDVTADPSYLSSEGGRGLVLIDMFMDEVRFNATGNEITLVKHAMGIGTSP